MTENPLPMYSQLEIIDISQCSCVNCDSIGCFTKRRHGVETCTCDKCKSSKTCLFYSNRMVDSDESMSDIKIAINDENDDSNTKINAKKLSKYSIQTLSTAKSKTEDIKTVTIVETLPSVDSVNVIRAKISSPTAKLSAQIMNVPYDDFVKSIPIHRPCSNPHNTLSKLDILNRIKEAYNACSCKVCECIDSISLPFPLSIQSDICSCKSCQCEDCRTNKRTLQCIDGVYRVNRPWMHSLRENFKAAVRESENWENIGNSCDCEPCQCIECNFLGARNARTVIVAPVGEATQGAVCQCSPCECAECGHAYGTIATRLTHEMATGISRHRNCHCEACLNEACDQTGTDSCRCDAHDKVMRKPVQRDTNDYDIRSVIVSNVNPTQQRSGKHDTLDMLSTLSDTYPIHGRVRNSNGCNCGDCQCVQCQYDKGMRQLLKKTDDISRLNQSDTCKCQCSPCECQICATNRSNLQEPKECRFNCECEECDCIHCADTAISCSNKTCLGSIYRRINKFSSQGVCDCTPCECIDCLKVRSDGINYRHNLDNTIGYETVYPIKKGKVLKDIKANTVRYKELLGQDDRNCSTHSNVLNNIEQDNYCYINSLIEKPSRLQPPECKLKYEDTVLAETCTLQISRDKTLTKDLDNNMMHDVSGSYVSALSSSGLLSHVVSKRNLTCPWQNSCNSSGYDQSDYLIRFPRSTAKTCLNEVTELNLDFKRSQAESKANFEIMHMKSPDTKTNEVEQIFDNKSCENCGSGKACECKPCNCDQCSFSKLKHKKCRCDCLACNCYGECLNEDQSVYIRTNEGTQTSIQMLQYHGQISLHSDVIFLEKDLPKTPFYSLLHNSGLEVSQDGNNTILKQSDSYINQEINRNWTYYPRTEDLYLQHGVDFMSLPVDINYESVHNAVREAREFSSQLLQILKKYEKANRDFESISQKLKLSHESYSHYGKCEESYKGLENMDLSEVAKKENELGNIETEDVKTCKVTAQIQNKPLNENEECILDNTVSNKGIDDQHQQSDEELKYDMTALSSYIFDVICKKIFNVPDELEIENRYKKYKKLVKRAVKVAKRFNSKSSVIDSKANIEVKHKDSQISKSKKQRLVDNKQEILIQSIDSEQNREKDVSDHQKISITVTTSDKRTKEHGELQKPIDDNLKTDDQDGYKEFGELQKPTDDDNLKTDDQDGFKELGKLDQTKEVKLKTSGLSKAMQMLVTEFGNTDVQSTSTNALEENMGINKSDVQVLKEGDENKDYPIMKKNFNLNSLECTRNKGVVFPALQVDIKEAIESISIQATKSSVITPKPSYQNKALTNLHVEVKNLLNMPLLQKDTNKEYAVDKNVQLYKTGIEFEDFMNVPILPSASKAVLKLTRDEKTELSVSSKSSYDALKITFQGVRRISDHTILVKWEPPRETKDIQGYELLVDGRPVQRVLSPRRCMAVVTCLPRHDAVLLTIRPISTSLQDTGYHATTTVYRPRDK